MLEAKVIEPAQSEWANQVILVPKQDEKIRFRVDYRKLNALEVKDTYPLPRMDAFLDLLGHAKVFSTLNCNSGYWQIPIASDDQDKTTFNCHAGTYRFTRMPFGLCNAPATFQRVIDILLMRYRWKTCLVYIDYIIIFSKNMEDHLCQVDEILQVLRDVGGTLRLAKCNFFTESVNYLGHAIRPGLLQVGDKSLDAIGEAKPPTTPTQVRSFLGLCNVYKRFVPSFVHISAPLVSLTTNDAPDHIPSLTAQQLQAFETLKNALIHAPIIHLPRSGLTYIVDTDASNAQLGCALFQKHEVGVRHPIGYWSRVLTKSELNYSMSEKECLTVVWALTMVRPYLERKKFVLNTDHQALTWLCAIADNQTTGRLIRWRFRLKEFDYMSNYVKGTSNRVADALSRLSTNGDITLQVDEEILFFFGKVLDDNDDTHSSFANMHSSRTMLSVEEGIDPIKLEEFVLEQAKDAFCSMKRTEMDREANSHFKLNEEGPVVRVSPFKGAEQIYVPRSLRARLLHN